MKKRINIDISESLWRRVGVEAAMRGIAKRELVEQALESYIKENQGGSEMTYEQMVSEARKRALHSGTFTDDPEEKADDVYLVKDIDLVVKAFLKDIEAGDTAEYSEPAELLDKHDIEWE